MDTFLYKQPWVPYMDNCFQSFLVLDYPKNMIFTAQILTHVLKKTKKINDAFPYVEKFDISTLNTIDWKNTIITVNKHAEFLVAPLPVAHLMNLSKRLDYEKARKLLFPPLLVYRYSIVVILMIIVYSVYLFRRYNLWYQLRYL